MKIIIAAILAVTSFNAEIASNSVTITENTSMNTELSDPDGLIHNDIDAPYSTEYITSTMVAIDDRGGNISEDIYIITDNFTGNETTLGDYVIIYGVDDGVNPTVTLALIIRNVDVTGPVIDLSSINTQIPLLADTSNFDMNIKAHDTTTGNVSASCTVAQYDLIDSSALAEYDVIVTCKDQFENSTSETITMSVVDFVDPVISGFDVMYKNSKYIMSMDDITAFITATDNVDGDISSNIEIVSNELIGNADKPGTYKMLVQVTDSSGNSVTKELTVKVIDSLSALLILDNKDVYLSNNQDLSLHDFVTLLQNQNDLPKLEFEYSNVVNTYKDNESFEGSYRVKFDLLANDGTEYSKDLSVHVETVSEDVIPQPEPSAGFGAILWNFLVSWWWAIAIVVTFVVGLFFS